MTAPLTVILYKRLEIEESVRQKMGAEQVLKQGGKLTLVLVPQLKLIAHQVSQH